MSAQTFIEFYRKNAVWLIAGIVILLANLGVLFFMSIPKINTEALKRQRLEQLQQQETQLNGVLEERRKLERFLNRNLETLQSFYDDVLGRRSERITAILKERQEIGEKFDVLPTRVSYDSQAVQGLPLERFSMSFPLNGSYGNLRFFIDTLEHSKNFFIIEDIELAGASTQIEELSMLISVATYFHGERSVREQKAESAENGL